MEHAKKLMLIEPKLFKASMREKTLSRLDEEIEETLNSGLDDGAKALKYIDALRRYKYYGEPVPEKKIEEKAGAESEILSTVSSAQRHKAKRLLDHLKRDSNFKIGDEGEIIYKQQKLHQSHVGDLLNDVLQRKSTDEGPLGWQEFSSSLKALGVPKDLIENPARWKHIRPASPPRQSRKGKKKAGGAADTSVTATPPSTPPRAKSGRASKRPPRWLSYDDDDEV